MSVGAPAYTPVEACASQNPEVMFPDVTDARGVHQARLVCRSCPVRERCLEAAVTRREPDGVWGGLTEPERERLRRRRYPRRKSTPQTPGTASPAPQHAPTVAWEDVPLPFAV